MSTSAITYISKGFCPSCRYDLTGLPLGQKITCPECGTATNCIDLPALPPPGWALAHAILVARTLRPTWTKIGITLAVLSIAAAAMAFMPGTTRCGCCRTWCRLDLIHRACVIYTDHNDGDYPTHIAALIPGEYFNPGIFEDVDSASPGNSLSVGGYNLSNYDWSDVETAKLTAAIDSIDTKSGYYHAGDFGFARLGQPTGDAAIIFAWSMPNTDGTRWVIFDDGHVTEVGQEGWRTVWKDDRVARYKLGLPVISPPLP